jgi:hypothetical protein
MTYPVAALPTLDALADYVRTTLCERDRLDPAQTPFFRTPVVRGGRPWGYLFHVEGPRLLKSSAVWAAESDAVVFYDSHGQKVKEVRLTDSPPLPDIRAAGAPPRVARTVRKSA